MLSAVLFSPSAASAEVSFNGLTRLQVSFARTIGSLARADYYKTDILASITVSQAILESGYAAYTLPVAANNLFGIRAYFTSPGMIFDPKGSVTYNTYSDLLMVKGASYANTLATWKANTSWRDSVNTHSWLLTTESRYKPIVGNRDYKSVARLLVQCGYCADNGYDSLAIKLIEQYGLTEYDDLTPDDDGIVAIIADRDQLWLDIGETEKLSYVTYPEGSTPSSVEWKSDNEAVATVDSEGNVKAIAHGFALITATLANGREACCIVYVDCNATTVDAWVKVHNTPNTSADFTYMYNGNPIKVLSDSLFSDSNGNSFYRVSGYNIYGNLISGYALADNVVLKKCEVTDIAFVKDSVTLVPGDKYKVAAAVAPALADDKSLKWSSSNGSVASVSAEGVVTARTKGSAEITAAAVNGVKKKLTVTVADTHSEYRALVAAYQNLTVRTEPDQSSSVVGYLPFLNEIRVTGEPTGIWCKVTGLNTAGRSITGYVNANYLLFIAPKVSVTRGKVADPATVFSEKTSTSYAYGALIKGSDYAVVGAEENGWSFVVGTRSPGSIQAVYGYARLSDRSDPGPIPGVEPPAGERYYADTTSVLRVRTGPGTGYDVTGTLPVNARVVIYGEINNGWYFVSGRDSEGNAVAGYSTAEYLRVIYLGETTTLLNLRAGPGTNYQSLGQLPQGTSLLLFGEPENNWYSVECHSSACSAENGYCSADFIRVTGRYIANVSQGSSGFGLNDNDLVLTDTMLKNVPAETTAEALAGKFSGDVRVTDQNKEPLPGKSLVGTGCKLVLSENGGETSVTIVVRGDVSGNGLVDATDYAMIKRAFLGTFEMDEFTLAAALVSGGEELTVTDYVMVKRTVLGTFEL